MALAGARGVIQFPHKLESSLGIPKHLNDQYEALQYFSVAANITSEVRTLVKSAIEQALLPWADGGLAGQSSPSGSSTKTPGINVLN